MCQYGHDDCIHEGENVCLTCFDSYCYIAIKQKKKYKLKKHATQTDKRQGARFEQKNHFYNTQIVQEDVSTSLTPNSGAGYIKGDEQISGIISIMEELKTKVKKQAPGKETFTIQKKWLDKLTAEASAANKEFWYLKFSFFEDDDNIYCIVPSSIIMSMIQTMITDRKTAKNADKKISVAIAHDKVLEAENLLLQAKIKELEAKLE
jgi:hypothetical protein